MNNKLINQILTYAQNKNSNQVVLEDIEQGPTCSFLRQGEKRGRWRLSKTAQENLISSFQMLTKTLEHDFYANKRIKIKYKQKIYNCRLSFLPAKKETKITMTLAENKTPLKRITSLGFNRQDLAQINQALKLKTGLILITGLDEAGKSTTYYSLLNKLAKENKSFYSLEEYPTRPLPYVTTLEINEKQSLISYLDKLRKIDADVIGIDQLKTPEEIALCIKQASYGHLIIASLKSKGAITALHTTLGLGLSPQEVAQGLRLIISQKLLKKNCPYCLEKRQLDKNWLKKIQTEIKTDYQPKMLASSHGCSRCNFTGHGDYLPIFELMPILPDATIAPSFKPMIFDALTKADNGVFSPEEILKSIKK